ncbi:MAG: hypothetical protein R2764_06230 [Bacteroidales bacterium]
MGNIIGKGASLILQIVFVVVLVLVFAWYDPFDIFMPTKLKLKNTPIQVQSIREIGELITAEYYGEVVASLEEVIGEKQFVDQQKFNYIVEDIHSDFKDAMTFLRDEVNTGNKQDIYDYFTKENQDLAGNPIFNNYLYFINEKLKNRNYKEREFDKQLSEGQQKRLIKKIYKNTDRFYDDLLTIQTTDFTTIKQEIIEKTTKKEFKRSRLVLVGRGWVKAGFRFGEFSDRNFRYDAERNRIHFIGMQPEIISATINPWFIPEEGVEGFEFLMAEKGARLKPEYTKMVKTRCLEKLNMQAMDKNILQLAQKNAEEHMKAFFSLLLDNEIEGVYFHADMLSYTFDVLMADSVIRNEEIFTIDSTLCEFDRTYKFSDKFEKMGAFILGIDSLGVKDFYGESFSLNSKSSLLFSIIQDRRIDSLDIVRMNNRTNLQRLDSLWQMEILRPYYENPKANVPDSEFLIESFESVDASFFADLNRIIANLNLERDTVDILNESLKERILLFPNN